MLPRTQSAVRTSRQACAALDVRPDAADERLMLASSSAADQRLGERIHLAQNLVAHIMVRKGSPVRIPGEASSAKQRTHLAPHGQPQPLDVLLARAEHAHP